MPFGCLVEWLVCFCFCWLFSGSLLLFGPWLVAICCWLVGWFLACYNLLYDCWLLLLWLIVFAGWLVAKLKEEKEPRPQLQHPVTRWATVCFLLWRKVSRHSRGFLYTYTRTFAYCIKSRGGSNWGEEGEENVCCICRRVYRCCRSVYADSSSWSCAVSALTADKDNPMVKLLWIKQKNRTGRIVIKMQQAASLLV